MTTMPPEMSTAATPTVTMPTTSVQRDSLSSLQSSRSRFMITDILAGSAAAAAAAIQNGGSRSSPTNNNNNGISALHSHQQQLQHHSREQQQHHVALQHYLAQQQHLLQQHHQHHFQSSPPPPPTSSSSAHHAHHHQHQQQQQQQQPHHQLPSHHPLSHLPHSALIGFPTGGAATNGLHAAQAAAHYAALHQERERLRELDSTSSGGGGAASSIGLDHDDRSRSPPHPIGTGMVGVRDLSGSTQNATGGGSSISGDQASTIDDSDSDTCAKDDDGNSIKSDNLMGLSKKQRKARTAFTDHQLQTLEKSFERQKYLSVQDRMELANKLELSDCQVKTWYQNRRTKWKRQTAVGLELLAEAGNYAAFQRLYGGGSPYLSAWPYAAQSPHGAPPSAIDLYYRQAAAAAALQKPLSYRMYPSVPPMGGIPGMSVQPSPMSHLSASNSLSSLSSYYQTATGVQPMTNNNNNNNNNSIPAVSTPLHSGHSPVQSDVSDKQRNSADLIRTPSPPLNPGSPPDQRTDNSSCPPLSDDEVVDADDDDDAIEV